VDDPDKRDGEASLEWVPPDMIVDVDKLVASFRRHFREAASSPYTPPDDPVVGRFVRRFEDQYRATVLDPGGYILAAMQAIEQSLGILPDVSAPVHEVVVDYAHTAAALDETDADAEELPQRDLFIQVILWLLAILTVAKLALDAHHDGQSAADSMLSNAPGYAALALAITWRVQDNKRK
jgi:hypothetical protein